MRDEPNPAIDTLLSDIEAANPGDGLALWWLGQSAFLVKSPAGRVLLDPYRAEIPTRHCADTDETLMSCTQSTMTLRKLTSIDVVASTRNQLNPLDAESLAAVFDANPTAALVVSEACRKAVAEQLGCNPAWPWGLRDGESISFGMLTVLAVPTTLHENGHNPTSSGSNLGYVVWFGGVTVFYCSEVQHHADTIDFLRPLAVDVALLPIHSHHPKHCAARTLAGHEAAQLAHDIGARLVIPYYGDLPSLAPESPALFEQTCRRLGQSYQTLRCGEQVIVPPK